MSFYMFMMRKYKGTNTPGADLAADTELDRDSFQRSSTGNTIYIVLHLNSFIFTCPQYSHMI